MIMKNSTLRKLRNNDR